MCIRDRYDTVEGNLQKEAGDHTVRVALKDTENYTWEDGSREEKTYPFAIGKKTITGTWQGLTQVYDGTPKTVTVSLKEMCIRDSSASVQAVSLPHTASTGGAPLHMGRPLFCPATSGARLSYKTS